MPEIEPRPPPGLRVCHLSVGDDDYALFEWDPVAQLPEGLSRAEREVVALALKGLSNSEIACARRTSIRTVANQLAAAYRKLSVASRLELFARAGGRYTR